ncbi:MAG: hypothetical protein KAU50_11975 [Candidatus Marinimicrobia bacterium]|nr:hypothetical protein [Candidatus Neomarinimicrobiota bacterium]
MSDQRLPKKPKEQTVDVNLAGLLLGCALLGITCLAIGLGVVSHRDRLKLRRQDALLAGVTELIQTIINLRGEKPCSGNTAEPGG